MVEAWGRDILGRGTAYSFERFGFSSGSMRYSEGSWAGPISLGTRLASSLSPIDYNLLVYEKGAYVLHMLRMLMYDFKAGNDDAFRAMMQDFVTTYRGRSATTEDFRRVVEEHMGGDLGWFFDQWVHGTAIPTYRYAWRTERGPDDQTIVKLRVRQSVKPDVPFKMFVPARFEFENGTSTIIRLPVHEPEREFSFELPAGLVLEDVFLNHANAVLAEVDEERW
jgi:aminopeptidase N